MMGHLVKTVGREQQARRLYFQTIYDKLVNDEATA